MHIDQSLRRYGIYILGAILITAVALRFIGLGAKSIWIDEGYSLWLSGQSWHDLWFEIPQFENNPPLYFMVLKAWRGIAGSGEFAIRFLSAVASLGVIVLLFVSGRIIGRSVGTDGRDPAGDVERGWALGLMAAALATLSQFQLALATDARPYVFCALGVSLTMAGTLKIVCGRVGSEPDGSRSLWAGAALVLGMALTIWSHTLGVVSAGLVGLFLIGWWLVVRRGDRGVFLRLAAAAALVILLCWPHFLNLLDQMSRDYSGFWIEEPSLRWLAEMTVHAAGLPGLPGRDRVMIGTSGLLLALGLAGLWSMGGRGNRGGVTAACLLVVLSAGYWLVVVAYTYLVQPVIVIKTLVFLQPAVLLIMAAAPWALPRGRAVLAAVTVAVAAVAAAGPQEVYSVSRPYRTIVQEIGKDPGAPVLALAGDVEIMLNYYEDRLGIDLDVRAIPNSLPHLVDGKPTMTIKPSLDRTTAERFVEELGDAQVVWLVTRPGHDESSPLLRQVLRDSGRQETVMTDGDEGLWRMEERVIVTRYETTFTAQSRIK